MHNQLKPKFYNPNLNTKLIRRSRWTPISDFCYGSSETFAIIAFWVFYQTQFWAFGKALPKHSVYVWFVPYKWKFKIEVGWFLKINYKFDLFYIKKIRLKKYNLIRVKLKPQIKSVCYFLLFFWDKIGISSFLGQVTHS